MVQLLQKGVLTIPYTNALLRSEKDLSQFVFLRSDSVNLPDFAKFSIFKDLVLQLGLQVSSEIITDAGIIFLKSGESINISAVDNRLILNLENSSVYTYEDKRFTPDTGDLLWTNNDLTITNSSGNVSILLIIDFKEFLLC